MTVLFIVGPKCTLAARRLLLPGESQTDRRTEGRTPDHYITFSARGGQRNNTTNCICVQVK